MGKYLYDNRVGKDFEKPGELKLYNLHAFNNVKFRNAVWLNLNKKTIYKLREYISHLCD